MVYLICSANIRKAIHFNSEIEATAGALAQGGSAHADSTFEHQLLKYKKRRALRINSSLKKIVFPLLSFQGKREKYVHHFVALVVDPEFKSLRNPFMRLHVGNESAARDFAKPCVKEVMIPLLISIHALLIRSTQLMTKACIQMPESRAVFPTRVYLALEVHLNDLLLYSQINLCKMQRNMQT